MNSVRKEVVYLWNASRHDDDFVHDPAQDPNGAVGKSKLLTSIQEVINGLGILSGFRINVSPQEDHLSITIRLREMVPGPKQTLLPITTQSR